MARLLYHWLCGMDGHHRPGCRGSIPEGKESSLELIGEESEGMDHSPVYTGEGAKDSEFSFRGGETYLPYQEAYLSACQAVASALSKERIPVRYRKQVKDYFEAIAPQRKKFPENKNFP